MDACGGTRQHRLTSAPIVELSCTGVTDIVGAAARAWRKAWMDSSRYELILLTVEGAVVTIQLNRPDVLNALNLKLMDEVVDALDVLESDPACRCVVITGNERAFAA